jgi:hypothetical protein
MVPLPAGTEVSGTHYGHGFFLNTSRSKNASLNLPAALHATYGQMLARRALFVVSLRSPLYRMHSAYYHARDGDPAPCMHCQGAGSFREALLTSVVAGEHSPPNYHDWVWSSMAGQQLQEWLKYFPADQFVISPFSFNWKGTSDSICLEVATRLKASLRCERFSLQNIMNARSHRTLQDEGIPPALITRFHSVMEPDMQLLVSTLAHMHLHGATLMNCSRKTSSESAGAVRAWLETHW